MPQTIAAHPQEVVNPILQAHGRDPGGLLQILVEVQHAFHWIPEEAVRLIADHLRVTRAHVRGLVGFYSFLSDTFLGDYAIYISDNITDRMLGNQGLAKYLCSRLGVKLGKVRADGRVSVQFTSCTGMCDQGPAALVNGLPITRLDRERVDRMVELITARTPVSG